MASTGRVGSEAAARGLVRAHWDRCYRAAYLIVRDHQRAEEVAQESMLALISSWGEIDDGRPLESWLHRVVVNKSLDLVRAERVRPQPGEIPEAEAAAAPSPEPDPALMTALGALGPDDRALLVLRYVLDYRAAEIGEFFDMPAATVRTRLHRSMERVRASLEANDADR